MYGDKAMHYSISKFLQTFVNIFPGNIFIVKLEPDVIMCDMLESTIVIFTLLETIARYSLN